MANTESDATYCSEVEKETNSLLLPIRRSKRLSQKLSKSIRSNGNPASLRFEEIYQMIQIDTFCNGWSQHNWLALKSEIGSMKNSLAGIFKSKITFVEKRIKQYLQKSSDTSKSDMPPEDSVECLIIHKEDVLRDTVKSPNILVGMTTEVLTELPLYQRKDSSNIMHTAKKSLPIITVTQVNALDLTKRQRESDQIESRIDLILNEKNKKVMPSATETSKDSMIDLTDGVEDNQANAASVFDVNPNISKNVLHRSKWLKYLPSEQKPKPLNDISKAPSPLRDKPKSLKQSLRKLYKDNPIPNNRISVKSKKSTTNRSPTKLKTGPKRSRPPCKESSKAKQLRNTETIIGQDFGFPDVQLRNVQSEHMSSLSPDFFDENVLQLDLSELNDDDSLTSLPFSLKASFKKVFGTDSLNDVLGCEKIIYSLTDRHVGRLASMLNIAHNSLKKAIERILADDRDVSCKLLEDDTRSGGSVVECSQSPPHRLFPSQRSQTSK